MVQERVRQIEEEGYTAEHDDKQVLGQLAEAAAYYAYPKGVVQVNEAVARHARRVLLLDMAWIMFPDFWDTVHAKKNRLPRRRQLEVAGALTAAELDRLERAGE